MQTSWGNLFITPSGTLKPQPFAIAAILIYVFNFILSIAFNAETMLRAGVIPLLGVQLALTWAWYAVHAKRLRDAGKGTTVAATIAVLYALFAIGFALLLSWAATPVNTADGESKSSLGMLIVILAVAYAFNTGDFGTLGLLIVAYLLLPVVLSLAVVIYSVVVGMRKSVTPEPTPPQLPAA